MSQMSNDIFRTTNLIANKVGVFEVLWDFEHCTGLPSKKIAQFQVKNV